MNKVAIITRLIKSVSVTHTDLSGIEVSVDGINSFIKQGVMMNHLFDFKFKLINN